MNASKPSSKRFIAVWLFVFVFLAAGAAWAISYIPKPQTHGAPGRETLPSVSAQKRKSTDGFVKIHLKFREGSNVRLRNGSLVTLGADDLLEVVS